MMGQAHGAACPFVPTDMSRGMMDMGQSTRPPRGRGCPCPYLKTAQKQIDSYFRCLDQAQGFGPLAELRHQRF